MKEFAHLHVHSDYSLLDGYSTVAQLARTAKEHGQPAIALTDHGNLHGAVAFYYACQKEGIKPIIGTEAYVTDNMVAREKGRTHLLLLAQNLTGYYNLLQLSTGSYQKGFYYKPRIDIDFLASHSEGLISSTGCMASQVNRFIGQGQLEQADKLVGHYLDIFGRDRFFLELQDHNIPELTQINRHLLEMNKRWGLLPVATNDVHYAQPTDVTPHDIMLCIQTGAYMNDPKRMRFSSDAFYLKTREQMERVWGAEALDNTLLIAEMCNVTLPYKGYVLPKYSDNSAQLLVELCKVDDPTSMERIEYELSIINQMGFADYFLILYDFCQFAKKQGIWWNVRGSAAGSMVAYTLGITSLNPMEHGLLFERFLNPNRVNMPDVDFDWPDDHRATMINYLAERWGGENVAAICTFGRIGARGAIKDVCRVTQVSLNEAVAVSGMVPAIPGKPCTIEDVLDPNNEFYSAEFAELYAKKPYLQLATKLEGVIRSVGVHPAGVVITPEPVAKLLPLMTTTTGAVLPNITQWDMSVVDKLGFLKVDFLGLRTLSVLGLACEMIYKRHGLRYDLTNIPYDNNMAVLDPDCPAENLFEVYYGGQTDGVFQVDGVGMTRMLSQMRPFQFDHIIAAVALFRPGPMQYLDSYIKRMHGEEEVSYHVPELESILSSTYGICVYQEQIMQIAVAIAGYSPGEADDIRKAVGKKLPERIKYHREKFVQGCVYGPEIGLTIWNDIEKFARYGFNKSHAAVYAKLSCMTAYIKRYYPKEFMAALLSLETDPTKKSQYLMATRRMGIGILRPDINQSEALCTVTSDAIRLGLQVIKNLGHDVVARILSDRQTYGPYKNLTDWLERIPREVRRPSCEALINVGAFDDFGDRVQLLDMLKRMLGYSKSVSKSRSSGQMMLFSTPINEWDKTPPQSQKITDLGLLDRELEFTGVYISGHPTLIPKLSHRAHDIAGLEDGENTTVCGLVTEMREIITKRGDPMGIGVMADDTGSCRVTIFPRQWENAKLQVGHIVVVQGHGQEYMGQISLILDTVKYASKPRHNTSGRS